VSNSAREGAQRSTLLLAASSGVSFLLGLARTKMLALAWGPAGIGQLGLMQAAMGTANLATGLGVDGVLAREVALVPPEERERALTSAAVGASALSLASAAVSSVALTMYVVNLGLGGIKEGLILGLGAGLSVLVANLRALTSGLGAVREIALATMAGAAVALGGTCGLMLVPTGSLAQSLAVTLIPLSSLVAFGWVAGRHVRFDLSASRRAVADTLRIAKRATVFTAAGILSPLGQSLVRTVATAYLTDVALGNLQAASAIAALSTSLLAASIGPVVIPQLSASLGDSRAFGALLSEHTSFLLLLYAPIGLVGIAAPGLVMTVLYSGDFSQGASQLSWQLIGEFMRLPLWLMSTTLVVLGRGRAYFLVEFTGITVQLVGLLLVLPMTDFRLIGMVFTFAALVQFALASFMLRDRFAWPARSVASLAGLVGFAALVATTNQHAAGMFVGGAGALVAAALAVKGLLQLLRRRSRPSEPPHA
jgi:antigen flippase